MKPCEWRRSISCLLTVGFAWIGSYADGVPWRWDTWERAMEPVLSQHLHLFCPGVPRHLLPRALRKAIQGMFGNPCLFLRFSS